ncbi:unnamed protein product, partial [marine sediment metagenome]
QVGDRLWVRETWSTMAIYDKLSPKDITVGSPIWYCDTGGDEPTNCGDDKGKTRPSMFMPRWASRITLEITEVRVERVQEIGGEEAMAEGIILPYRVHGGGDSEYYEGIAESYIHHFSKLWDSLNAKRGYGWEVNPWVWVISFEVV